MKLITIHGIRRKNKWYETFAEFEEIQANDIQVIHFEYGYLDLFRFLFPRSRQKIIDRFQEFYSNNIAKGEDSPSAICHSFGTYIFYSAIDKHDVIKFDKVILCGSILNPETDWARFFKKQQIRKVYHDYGMRDNVVILSKLPLGKSAGASGKYGFQKIPKKYLPHFIQEKNNFDHSSYFLPLHMEEKWVSFMLADIAKVHFNRKILRQSVVERLYGSNIDESEQYTKVNYSARIDMDGNYYANYIKEGISHQDHREGIEISTTADAVNNFNVMNFRALDHDGKFLAVHLVSDMIQEKKVRICFPEPLRLSDHFWISCRFKWIQTMDVGGGDTDHFWVKNCDKYSININFPRRLKSPAFIAFKAGKALKRLPLELKYQKDGSVAYSTKTESKADYEGVFFYYEGIEEKISTENLVCISRHDFNCKSGGKFYISTCRKEDIKHIYKIECDIERGNAAEEKTLYERLKMYPYGFLVAKNEAGDVVGYLESTVWRDIRFERFSEIADFPLFHNIDGDTLYIIFVAVDRKYRDQYIGLELIKTAILLGRKMGLKQAKLVAKDVRIGLYQKCGFNYVRELPGFLSDQQSKNILMTLQL